MEHILKSRTWKEYWQEQENDFKARTEALYQKWGTEYPWHFWASHISSLVQIGYKERDLNRVHILRPDRKATDQDWKGHSGETILALLKLHDPEYSWLTPYNGKYERA